jgi:predicted nucleotidyltransferase
MGKIPNIKNLETLLDELKNELVDLYDAHLRSIILYGSFARGDYDSESDIDIMILLDLDEQGQRELRRGLAQRITDLSIKYNILISAIDNNYDAFNSRVSFVPFYSNVAKEGVNIYAN